ncbi:MAG: hypothetical protein JXA21_12265 [Anaerolineae bacterium]|nr:hypothetical protein [Anaerolineae bacterium]
MICPSCKTETKLEVTKVEYIYPNSFFGMPVFWSFMTPAVARLTTIVIGAVGVVLATLAILWISQGRWVMGLLPLLICALTVYTVIVCIQSLDKYQIKNHYKCLSCRLEWSGDLEERQQ